MALIDLSVVEQRYRAVLAVQAGARVGEVAASVGISRQSLHTWVSRYRDSGLAGLADRSHRPDRCPHRADAVVEAVVCELRRRHPKWGPQRIFAELARNGSPGPVPARMTVYRILLRHGLIDPSGPRRKRQYRRWQRDAPMQLWQLDIVGGVLIDGRGGSVEAKVVTGVDDCSRFAVLATVVPRATGRAVCLGFASALAEYGIPDEVLTDNGKQFTARFGTGGEVLFDRICRDNGITHRLTAPASPTTTGKIERLHATLRRELLDEAGVFTSIEDAQAAVDAWRTEYNHDRPHQSLDLDTPARRFTQRPDRNGESLLPLKLPAVLTALPTPTAPAEVKGHATDPAVSATARPVQAVEFERVVPPSGNLWVTGRQFWLTPARAGLTVTFWADTDLIHLLIAGVRIKTLRSHLSTKDLTALAAQGARPAGPSPLPPVDGTGAVELERMVAANGTVGLGGHRLTAAELLAGLQVSIRIDEHTLTFYDPDSRQLLRTRPSPFTYRQARLLRGARPAGPSPRPALQPVTVQRRASATGTIMIAGQVIHVGRPHAGHVITAHVAETTITIDLGDGEPKIVARTTTKPIRNVKADRPHARTN